MLHHYYGVRSFGKLRNEKWQINVVHSIPSSCSLPIHKNDIYLLINDTDTQILSKERKLYIFLI